MNDESHARVGRREFLSALSWGAVAAAAGPAAGAVEGVRPAAPGFRPLEGAGEGGPDGGRLWPAEAALRFGAPVVGQARLGVRGLAGGVAPLGRYAAGVDLHVRFLPHHRVPHRAWGWTPGPGGDAAPVTVGVPVAGGGEVSFGLEPLGGSGPVPLVLPAPVPGRYWVPLDGAGRVPPWGRCRLTDAGGVVGPHGPIPCLELRVEQG